MPKIQFQFKKESGVFMLPLVGAFGVLYMFTTGDLTFRQIFGCILLALAVERIWVASKSKEE